ncbi:YjcQ family protein [Ileibacterium valens]|uniref:YjcQ family protein n=1 Tax=Ileibacterium valens TaxID=1862668 RepID=UPI0024BB54E9|nr:YjcQ family protein [Ileibacterium valens]
MANDDMTVVIYKILTYLYECMKQGKRPAYSDIQSNSAMLHIPEYYWQNMIEELIDNQLIKGLKVVKTKDGSVFADNGLRITLKGVEYPSENSSMKKAGDFLGQAFLSAINGMVCGLTSR